MQRHCQMISPIFARVPIGKHSKSAQYKFLTSETCIDHNDSSSWDLFKDVVRDCNRRRGSNFDCAAPTDRLVKTNYPIPPFVKKHLSNQPDRRSAVLVLPISLSCLNEKIPILIDNKKPLSTPYT